MTKQNMWKKTAITSLALMMLTGGATAAFADNGRGNGGGRDDDRNNQKEDSRHNDKDDDDKYKVTWKFEDEDDLKWATEYIMRLASKGIFTGYDDGTFKPANKITRIEALTAAVRLMGLREQAESAEEMSTELQFKDADKIKKKYPWAVGYVAVALENDLFTETDTEVKPEAQATRLWSTILLIKALKLEDEAKALNNTKLEFKDANQIPAGAVGYVALALEKGIITGYEDRNGKTFRPNQPVSRAELAALLDRTDEEMPDQDATAITGTLKAAASGGKITVVKADKSEVVLTLDSNVFIFRDDKKAAVSALRAGDEVLVRTYQSKVVFIEVTEAEPEVVSFSETGKVKSLTFDSSAKLFAITVTQEEDSETNVLIYAVSPNVKIVGNASLLKEGQSVKVTGKNAIVETIEIK
ncbi:S-layer homology domain-containing protein [Paenibacillus sp. YIM B09110]|uniref:S-layer homology domain-containing protein n=1 Tax=Paenibacillus sp. YIM B09110 TaxID=3126102 RepID=UPI00301E32F8